MQVKFGKIRGIEELEAFLRKLPRGGVRVALKAFTEYVIGAPPHGLRHDEPQKYVSRKRAGYKTSAKQIRYFFAVGILQRVGNTIKLNRYKRTGQTAAAWSYVAVTDWKYKITNDKEGAYRTRDMKGQTRQHQIAGRRKVLTVIMANFKGGVRHANAALKQWIKENRRG